MDNYRWLDWQISWSRTLMDDLMDEMDDHEQSVEGSRDGHARVSKMKKTTVLNTFTLFLFGI